MFNTSRNKSSSPSVKAMQICPRIKLRSVVASLTDSIYRDLKGMFSPILDSNSIDNLSIEIHKNQFSRSNFTHIRVYLFRLRAVTLDET